MYGDTKSSGFILAARKPLYVISFIQETGIGPDNSLHRALSASAQANNNRQQSPTK
jgi:hypothetical protein